MRRIAVIAMVLLSVFVLTNTDKPTHVAAQETNEHASQNQVAQTEQQPEAKKKTTVVEVQRGDSLSKIAKRHNSTYKRIYYFNKKVKDPSVIYPGQKLKIPSEHRKLRKRALPSGTIAPKATAKTSSTYQAPEAPVSMAGDNVSGGVWDRLAGCESGGNWHINTGNGYYGGLQFSLSSWRGVGGSGYPHQASKSEQIKRATMLKNGGGWGHWPACSAKLGLR